MKFNLIQTLLPLVGGLLNVVSSNPILSCGSIGGALTILEGDATSLDISNSVQNTLCMLFRVTAASETADLSTLSSTSSLSDFNMVPVSRSYDGKNWQRVAGAYAQDLNIACSSGQCSLAIPTLPHLEVGKFVLMPFENSLDTNDRASVSRFFQRTTFGPTLAMINSWNYSVDLLFEMSSWVKDQVDEAISPITSHREFFRKRLNGELERDEEDLTGSRRQMFKVRHPCDVGARWMTYSFSTDDYGRLIDVIQDESTGYYRIMDNDSNVAKTIVPEWKDSDGNDLGPGTFHVQWRIDEFLGGRVQIRNETHSIYIRGGNPPVNLPVNTPNVTFVDLPALASFTQTSTITVKNYWDEVFDETLYLINAIDNDPFCSNFDSKDTLHIIGNLENSNVQVRYGRYIAFEENTLVNPIPSGSVDLEVCSNPLMDWKNAESCHISSEASACRTETSESLAAGSAIVVCGSSSEIANDPVGQSVFHAARTTDLKSDADTSVQKESVWSMIALSDSTVDQLRQRVAWALSQILVITQNQIENVEFSEIFLNYYDIFVKNAFTNYFDILKEVSYSAMMGEMLSYVGSKSMPFVKKDTAGLTSFPDENYARELQQLFSIGIHELNIDGTLKLNNQGLPTLTYTDEDIQNFARVWTGFHHAPRRANSEAYYWDIGNRIDSMVIHGPWRDYSPKADLRGGYIGDGYQLCTDLPDKHFLWRGATYRLVGSSKLPLLHTQPTWWFGNGYSIRTLDLNTASPLYNKLCNESSGSCNFAPVVTLDVNLSCDNVTDPECLVDDLRLIKVRSNPDVHYEYVRVPCVEHTFYENSKTIQLHWPQHAMCANGDLPLAADACCDNPSLEQPGGVTSCKYSVEKTTFATSKARCEDRFPGVSAQCAWAWQEKLPADNGECHRNYEDNFYWASSEHCQLQAKITNSGTIAVVHNPVLNPFSNYATDINADISNINYFKVDWTNGFPDQTNCSNTYGCSTHGINECLCDVSIVDTAVFDAAPESGSAITSQLKIGGADVTADVGYSMFYSTSEYIVYQKIQDIENGIIYNKNTVFKILNHFGEQAFFKNMESQINIGQINIGDGVYSFRNPVQFLNPGLREGRDAQHETDAVLKYFVRHPNTAPFLARKMIQRFGTSNPSPTYVQAVAMAFTEGVFSTAGQVYGDYRYGSMEALVAAVVLHEEATRVLLDSDPSAGSLREPLLKVIGFLKSMEFSTKPETPEPRFYDMQQRIGQMAHNTPNVFSFYLPEYSAPGHIKAASLTSPEAQVMNGPTLTSFINGQFALVEMGLNRCYGGFGDYTIWSGNCDNVLRGDYPDINVYNRGSLNYSPPDTSSASAVVDDLVLLITAGRLHPEAKAVLEDAYTNLGGITAVQKLVTTLPEYHATGLVNSTASLRPEASPPVPSSKGYKAIVFLNLSGGADTFNMFVPHSGCTGKDMYQEYKDVRTVLALDNSTLLQIDASGSGQICDTFGLHPNLGSLQSLYNASDLVYISNIGVLQEYADKSNWRDKTDATSLFAHNTQQSEIQSMDIYEQQAGRGVAGRCLDVLSSHGFKVNALSTKGATEALRASVTPLIVVPSVGSYEKIDPMSSDIYNDPNKLIDKIKDLNTATKLGSSLFTETYSSVLHQSLAENQLLFDSLQSVVVDTTFPTTDIGKQFKTVSQMMKTKDSRGVDRDVFYVEQGGYDTHSNLNAIFNTRTEELNAAVDAFVKEMKIQGIWDESITVVAATEFSRTLTTNTGAGSDHGWGSNIFAFGGAIDGGKVLGTYPDDLKFGSGPLIINTRGIVLPTTPYDALWNGVAQWFGVTDDSDLDVVLPNRNSFAGNLFSSANLYGITTTSSPTISMAPVASPPPSSAVSESTMPSKSPTPDMNIIDFDWFIPGTSVIPLQTVLKGTTVRFTWSGQHNLYISTDGSCNGEIYVGDESGTTYTFDTEGQVTFVCTLHCDSGQQMVTFDVLTSMIPSASPTVSSRPSTLTKSISSKPSVSPSKTPTVNPKSQSPTQYDTCSTYTGYGSCKKVSGCIWNGTICSSSEGNPPTPPSPTPPSPTPPPPSPTLPNSCGFISGAKQCKDTADCEWLKGNCVPT